MVDEWGNAYGRQRRGYVQSIIRLLGHLIGTAIIFSSFFVIGWAVSVLLHWLHHISPFPQEIFDIVVMIEVWVFYLDAAACAIVIIAGLWKFVKDVAGDHL